MSEPTISLRELREWATDPSAFPPRHALQVLALVEAVEAAQRLNVLKMNDTYPSLQLIDLRHALARFSDFGTEASS